MIQYAVSVVDSADDRRSLHSLPLYPLKYTPPFSSTLHWKKYFMIHFSNIKITVQILRTLPFLILKFNNFAVIFESILNKVP